MLKRIYHKFGICKTSSATAGERKEIKMILFEVYDKEGKIIASDVDKEKAAQILGVQSEELYKKSLAHEAGKRLKIKDKSYIMYSEGQTLVREHPRRPDFSQKLLMEFDYARKLVLAKAKSCTGATGRK